MGRVGEDRRTSGTARYTVAEAADMLGITTGAVYNRLSRGTLQKEQEGGTVYVLLPADKLRDVERDTDNIPGGMPPPAREALTSELRDRLRYVEGQLDAERQAHGETRRLLAAALERIPAIEAPQEEHSPGPDAPQAPERGEELPGRGEEVLQVTDPGHPHLYLAFMVLSILGVGSVPLLSDVLSRMGWQSPWTSLPSKPRH